MKFKSIGDKYRQNYCDLYPQTRRENLSEKRWLAGLSVVVGILGTCMFFLVRLG